MITIDENAFSILERRLNRIEYLIIGLKEDDKKTSSRPASNKKIREGKVRSAVKNRNDKEGVSNG